MPEEVSDSVARAKELPISEQELGEMEQRSHAAHRMVCDLCQRKREWIMSIPARPDYDPDLVIDRALADNDRLVKCIRSLVEMREEAQVWAILGKHRRHILNSPGVGASEQDYAIAVLDDIAADLRRLKVVEAPAPKEE